MWIIAYVIIMDGTGENRSQITGFDKYVDAMQHYIEIKNRDDVIFASLNRNMGTADKDGYTNKHIMAHYTYIKPNLKTLLLC